MRKKLGETLVQAGLLTEEDLRSALAEHKRSGERLGAVLVRLNLATERQIAKALSYQLGFQYINLVDNPPEPGVVQLIPKDVAVKRACLAWRLEKNVLTVAMADPLHFNLVQDLGFRTGYRIKQVVATRGEILDAINAHYPESLAKIPANAPSPNAPVMSSSPYSGGLSVPTQETDVFAPIAGLKDSSSEAAPIIDLVDLVLKSAVKSAASDIHVEPMEKGVLVRHRLDGILKEVMDLPKWVHEGLIARMKIMAGMDIAEKRLPQDGRIRVTADGGREVDFRASTLRTLHGEKIVLRVLDHRKGPPSLEDLGFQPDALEQFRQFLRHQHGMILVVGPTGSGKTTTLSSALTSIQSQRTNIITIEDPIEYQLPGINQTQINDKIKLTFAAALRSILRQDPDVILVGEIRDLETARIATQAAQTGHLVLSTLHTDDAPSTITRLMDIGIESYVFASAAVGIVAQRLMRRLCQACRRSYTPPADILRAMNISDEAALTIPFFTATGCDQCNQTGYRGRVGIYEVMAVTDKVRRLIAAKAPEDSIREAAQSAGMSTLGEDGLAKVKAGLTTPEELLRVVTEVKEMRTACPSCAAPIAMDFIACPHCGKRISGACPGCARTLEPGWQFCPYCARTTDATTDRRLPGKQRELPSSNVAEFKTGVSG
jgi:type IV pilus assembly protein PilB